MDRCTFIGSNAGGQAIGNSNTAIGRFAGQSMRDKRNTAIGESAGLNSFTNDVAIGYNAYTGSSNGNNTTIGANAANGAVGGGALTGTQSCVYIGRGLFRNK